VQGTRASWNIASEDERFPYSLDKRENLRNTLFCSDRRGRAFSENDQTSSKRSTIAELAAQAGVSIPTVSRVLNGRPDVAPATRARIEQIIKESGYIRSSAAKGLRKGSSGIIDLVVPGLENPYVTEIVRGVEDALERTGLRLALSFTQDQALGERQWLEKNR